MKKLFILFAFLGVLSFTVEAQSCSGKKTASTEKVCSKTAAAKLASLDNEIESRTCASTGNVSYVRKSVCSASGKVSFADVEYCSKSNKFVNLSPSEMTAKGGKACCSKKTAAACCSKKGASAKTVSAEKKACSSAKKACCKKGSAVKKTASATKSNVKLVKGEGQE